MAKMPRKVSDRISKQLKTYQKVLRDALDRDVNESDTVTIITDMLGVLFGYDKYVDVTSEQAIRGTYCDLAVKQKDTVKFLIEVKAIGLTLKENHLRQAINYGANHGVPWVVLTNGVEWEVHKINFEQPISHDQILAFNLLELSPRKASDQELIYLLSKEGLSKSAIEDFHDHVQVVNRFMVGAVIRSDSVLSVIRRELRRMSPGASVNTDEIDSLLPDVLKRDVIEGESAKKAKQQLQRAAARPRKKKRAKAPEPREEQQL